MMHGPCDPQFTPYMKDGKCSKGFPKELQNETKENKDGQPMHERRNDGS
jgi:hypothetical protein